MANIKKCNKCGCELGIVKEVSEQEDNKTYRLRDGKMMMETSSKIIKNVKRYDKVFCTECGECLGRTDEFDLDVCM